MDDYFNSLEFQMSYLILYNGNESEFNHYNKNIWNNLEKLKLYIKKTKMILIFVQFARKMLKIMILF